MEEKKKGAGSGRLKQLRENMKRVGLDLIVADHKVMCNAIFHNGQVERISPSTGDKLSCPMCHGSIGFVVKDPNYRAWSCAEDICIRLNAKRHAVSPSCRPPVCTLEDAGCPRSMKDAHPSRLEAESMSTGMLSAWMKNPRSNLLLYGNPGTGKTYAACALLAHWIESQRKTGRFISWDEMHRGWLDEFNGKGERDLSYKLSEIPLLVVDDIGSREMTEKFLSWFQVVAGIRYDNNRPTLFTSNLQPEQLERQLGAPIWSRLNVKSCLFEGQDRRLF